MMHNLNAALLPVSKKGSIKFEVLKLLMMYCYAMFYELGCKWIFWYW